METRGYIFCATNWLAPSWRTPAVARGLFEYRGAAKDMEDQWSCFRPARHSRRAIFCSFHDVPDELGLEDIRRDSRVGGVLPLLIHDSRDNIFTPLSGINIELSGGVFS